MSDPQTTTDNFIERTDLTPQDTKECARLLHGSVMFKYVDDDDLIRICKEMKKQVNAMGDVILRQGDPSDRMFVVASGTLQRIREEDEQVHKIDTAKCGTTVGSLHLIRQDTCFATAQATSPKLITYTLDSQTLNRVLIEQPKFATGVIYSLTKEVRTMTKQMRTPLLEQRGKHTNYIGVSIAASIESFYRSALNAILNTQLSGVRGPLFPNMHIQLPTRVVYINGFKGLRTYFDSSIHAEDYKNPNQIRLMKAIAPGLIMTPISNILEATLGGKNNPEPLWKRSYRGTIPRAVREVIFGIGINQLSDYCEERASSLVESKVMANAIGSMGAGIISGYISHIPHNLATLKLLNPNLSYKKHFQNLMIQNKPAEILTLTLSHYHLPSKLNTAISAIVTCLFPRGVVIRTTQIVGSFIVLNGTIHLLQHVDFGNLLPGRQTV